MQKMSAAVASVRARCPQQSEPFLISLPGGVNCGHAENMRTYQAL
jgi:hypothetical protein